MHVSRRLLLGGGAMAATVALGSKAAFAFSSPSSPALIGLRELNARTLSFDCCQTGEKLKNVTYWAEGNYVPGALTQINHTLRDFMSGEVYPMDPGVLDILHRVGRTLETDGRFEIVCGYRSPATNAKLRRNDPQVAAHSLHMKGQAIDFDIPGKKLSLVHATALAQQVGGVGYYPDADFIHVDTGRVRRWTGLG
jgi:uncharacterized protein YcbK (DUF882 family)